MGKAWVLLAFLILLPSVFGSSQNITLNYSFILADTYLDRGSPDANAANTSSVPVGSTSSGPNLWMWNVSGLPDGYVRSAEFHIWRIDYYVNGGDENENLTIYRINNNFSWGEWITWNTPDSFGRQVFGSYLTEFGSYNYTGMGMDGFYNDNVSLNVTSLLRSVNTLVLNNFSIAVIHNASGSTQSKFNTFTKESGNKTAQVYLKLQIDDGLSWNYTELGNVSFDNCSIGSTVAAEFRLYDEDLPNIVLNGSVEVSLNYWSMEGNVFHNLKNFSWSGSGQVFKFCINEPLGEVFGDLYVKSRTADNFTHRYYEFNSSFSKVLKNVSLYNYDSISPDLSQLSLTIRKKSDYSLLENVVAKLDRKYLGENVWRTVQMDKSSNLGTQYFDVYEKSVDYRLIFSDVNNNVLEVSDNLKFSCTSGLCDVTYLVTPVSELVVKANLSVLYVFNNNTGVLYINFSDHSGKSNSIKTTVTRIRGGFREDVCQLVSYDLVGNYSCSVGTGEGSYLAITSTSNSPDVPADSFSFSKVLSPFSSVLDVRDAAFINWGISTVLVCIGFLSPVLAVILLIVSSIFTALMGFVVFQGYNIVIVTIIIAVFVLLRVKHN